MLKKRINRFHPQSLSRNEPSPNISRRLGRVGLIDSAVTAYPAANQFQSNKKRHQINAPQRKLTTDAILPGAIISGNNHIVDLKIVNGRIVDITKSSRPAQRLLMPLMADARVHLDKTGTVERTGSTARSVVEAMDRIEADKSNWTETDIYERASHALQEAWLSGVAAMRSHVDWTDANTPLAWSVLNEVRREWQGRVDLQLAASVPLDTLVEIGSQIASRIQRDNGVLGVLVQRNSRLREKIADVFALSHRFNLPLDFRMQEGFDPTSNGFDEIVRSARAASDGPPVLCGNPCSLSTRPHDEVTRLFAEAARARVGLVALPTGNRFLQLNMTGRTACPCSVAPIRQAKSEGVDVLLASGNVRDIFFPYGSFDLFDLFRLAIQFVHLQSDEWLSSISTNAGDWCKSRAIAVPAIGQPASFIEFNAGSLDEVITNPSENRHVWRDGIVL